MTNQLGQAYSCTRTINIGEAKNRLSELVASALRGEEVVLQRAGEAKVRLVALPGAIDQERTTRGAKRRAAIGFGREKYSHLPPQAFDVPGSMTETEQDERFERKFRAPAG